LKSEQGLGGGQSQLKVAAEQAPSTQRLRRYQVMFRTTSGRTVKRATPTLRRALAVARNLRLGKLIAIVGVWE
jgi:hypothetical protein